MSLSAKDAPKGPWYHEKWVWFLVGVPATSVVLSMIMVYVAVSGRDGLVADDYYKEGLAINESLRLDQEAQVQGLSADMRFEADGHVYLQLNGSPALRPDIIVLTLEHPTLTDADQSIPLVPQGDGYAGLLASPPVGKRYLSLTDAGRSWRLQREVGFPIESIRVEPQVRRSNG